MKIIITGSSGMLGKEIYSTFNKNTYHELFGIDKIYNSNIPSNNQFIGDLTNHEYLKYVLNRIDPDLVIHCAAIVDLYKCEKEKKFANDLHLEVPRYLVNFKPVKTKIIFISTDSIFDGVKGNYSETDIPNPLNYYAKSKLEGELVISSVPNNLIIRTNIFGYNLPMKNSLAEWAITNYLLGKRIKGYTDILFNAIYTKQLAEIIIYLVDKKVEGLLHIGSLNKISKYSFMKYLCLVLTNRNDLVEPILYDKIKSEVKRPKDTSLNINRILSMISLPTIEEGIEKLVQDYLKASHGED